MLAFLLGVERLRLLDRGTGGALWRALALCKDGGLEPHLTATAPTDGAPETYEVVFLARDAQGLTAFHELWRLTLADDVEAYGAAVHLALQGAVLAARAQLARVDEGLAALNRDEDPPPWRDEDPNGRMS